ncbi:DUF1833 domain-containing protein [Candidatus Parcubacteria bacterium]|nr:DUF1833 domain-containing protein [Candidatus Parcubacteria bacterium]
MPRNISQNFRNQLNGTEVYDTPLVILSITHESITPQVIRVVNNNQDIIYDGDTYLATSFSFVPPEEEGESLSNAKLTISNIDRRFIALFRTISGSPSITAEIVLVGDNVVREAGPWEFQLSQISYNSRSITGVLSYDLRIDQILSPLKVTLTNFPGLVQ